MFSPKMGGRPIVELTLLDYLREHVLLPFDRLNAESL
jgi:hypothetical protein